MFLAGDYGLQHQFTGYEQLKAELVLASTDV